MLTLDDKCKDIATAVRISSSLPSSISGSDDATVDCKARSGIGAKHGHGASHMAYGPNDIEAFSVGLKKVLRIGLRSTGGLVKSANWPRN